MSQEYYWSIAIEANFIQAAIWTIESEITKVVATGAVSRWEAEDDLVNAADASLSSAVANLEDPNIEPSKCVFGVPPSWVEAGQIKREHLDKIRSLCSKLSLEPTGFVVLSEAIAHFIKSEEGSPLNGVVIGVGANTLDVSVFKLGNLAGSVEVARSVSVIEDVVESLARFQTGAPLPSRFLLYDGKSGELEEVRQALIQADWKGELADKLTFLHTPQVEIIEAERKIVAVCLAGASEMSQVTKVELVSAVQEESDGEPKAVIPDEQPPKEEFDSPSPEEVGFVVNEELESRLPDESDDNLVDTGMPAAHHTTSVLKFKLAPLLLAVKRFKLNLPKRASDVIAHNHPPTHTAHMQKMPSIHIGGIKRERTMMMGGIGLVALLVILFGAWWILPRSEVTIFISPRTLEKSANIEISTNATSANIESRVIPGETKTITVKGDKTTSTTGRKTVGEKAKGTVTVRNGTSVGIKVNAGTTLFGPNDLKFVTDAQASVSAAESPSSPGSQDVAVTAESIGSDYNLAQGETFKVGNYPKSEVDAVVAANFTGGSSREITAVSAEDQKSLESGLTAELTDQGQSQFTQELAEDEIFVTDSLITSVKSRSFSNKVGDEASSLRLSLELEVTGTVVKRSDLNAISMAILQEQVPSGFALREEQVEIDFDAIGDNTFDTSFTANLLPEVNPDEIKRKIAGKNPTVAQNYLASIPGFVRAQIKINPLFPGKLGTLPRMVRNIDIIVAAEK